MVGSLTKQHKLTTSQTIQAAEHLVIFDHTTENGGDVLNINTDASALSAA